MRKTWLSVLAALLAIVIGPATAGADAGLLRTVHAIDEARGYCLDIAGVGATLRLDDPLQAHTCKYGAELDDQRFEQVATESAIKASAYDRCLTASALEPAGKLVLRNCAGLPSQQWTFASGRLSPKARTDLCASLAGERGEIAGTPILITPVYRHRNVTLERCDQSREAQQTFRWSTTDERGQSRADMIRQGMPAAVAARLASFGHEFDGTMAAETAKIYASLPRVYEQTEFKVTKNVPYGPHERQQMDIYTATVRRSDRPVPVVVAFHGGGLVGGSRAGTTNVAEYFASLGYVGVTSGYRLAPDHKWPEGARDVGAAVTWLHAHAAEYGGDPERIFVVGISTGAFHAATYVFRPELVASGTARPAGAVLVSGPYAFDFNTPSKGELAYFGEDRTRWSQMVVPGNVTRTDIPVLFTTAEWDHFRYTRPYADLFRELVGKDGVRPRYSQSLGHNHSSQLLSVGTADTSVSAQIVDFIERTARR
ncbi:MAG TPA: alpha/beta hydrolase fold domain-containing protein [Vicinamibacterales bacterium]|jgi:triacylglycerol lipase